MDAKQYLSQTEQAVGQSFDALKFYRKMLMDINLPVFVSSTSDEHAREEELREWYEQNSTKIQQTSQQIDSYMGYTVSESTICGSILQIAFMGLQLFSQNSVIPATCVHIVSTQQKAVRFCIGREIRGLPLGLIIYAGRNQYNHMDEPALRSPNKEVFEHIATYYTSSQVKDPSFDLSNPLITNYAANILALLRWRDYDEYLADMRQMLA